MNTDLLYFIKTHRNTIESNIVFSITDVCGNILYVNKKFCEISKYSEKEIIGKNFNILKSGFHSDEFYKNLWSKITSGKIWQGELKNKAKDDTFFWIDALIFPVFNKNHNIINYFTIQLPMEKLNDQRVVNTTDRNDIEQILNMISHNIRKPISTTLGLIKIIETETDFKTGDKEFFKMIGYLKSNVEELDLFTREMNELFSRFSIK